MRKLVDVNPFRRRNSDDWESEEKHYAESKRDWLKNILARLPDFRLKDWRIWIGLLITAAVVWKLLILAGFLPFSTFPAVDRDKWQAVFLNNSQVYFGHLKNLNKDYISLENIYYLRAAQPLQPLQQNSQQINLVKLGEELHGPEDILYIPKSQISFWENLRGDSQVVRIIKQLRNEK